jgi:hypothetical protein
MTDTAPSHGGTDDTPPRIVRQLAAAITALGPSDPELVEVITNLNLRVHPGDPHAGDRTAYVVLDIHGVSIGVKRRAHDLYVHADTTETSDRLIAFEINGRGETDHLATNHTSEMGPVMDLNDAARVRHPRSSFEQRLGTIIAVEPQPGALHRNWYRLQFPTGETRWYLADSIHHRNRADERRHLLDALTAACEALQQAEQLGYDYDQPLGVDLGLLAIELSATVRYRLDVSLDGSPKAGDAAHAESHHEAGGQ